MTAAHYAGLSRIPLAFAAAFLILEVPAGGRVIAAVVVVLAGVTDILDGALARRQRTVSSFGAVLDFTADKVFMLPTLFLAVSHDATGLWLATVIAVRDLLVMGVRTHAAAEGAVIAVSRLGKFKSLLLYVALGAVLLGLPAATALLSLATIAAVVSGGDYIRRAWPLLAPPLLRPHAAAEAPSHAAPFNRSR
jgi:CDP-diacylglycerol--glycerol-3-phosphate 3-phosphatidyltransferase